MYTLVGIKIAIIGSDHQTHEIIDRAWFEVQRIGIWKHSKIAGNSSGNLNKKRTS